MVDDALHVPEHPVRIVTAAQPVRRPRRRHQHHAADPAVAGLRGDPPRPQPLGATRSLTAVVQEDAQGVAVSSYQGGHDEYFRYLVDELRARGLGHVRVYGGGGGVIVPDEIAELQAYGVTRIFSPEDGQRLGLGADDQHDRRGLRRRPGRPSPLTSVDERAGRRPAARWRGPSPPSRLGRLEPALLDELRVDRRRAHGARARHHRHRRLGQVVAHRRARAPLPPRPGGQAPHRGARHRPHPAPGRRGAARRPHPHERDRAAPGVRSARSPPGASSEVPEAHRRHHRRVPGGRATTS